MAYKIHMMLVSDKKLKDLPSCLLKKDGYKAVKMKE